MSILPDESVSGFRQNQEGRSSGQRFSPGLRAMIASFPPLVRAQLFFPFLAAGVAAQKRRNFLVREFATVFACVGFGNAGSFRKLNQNNVAIFLVGVCNRAVAVGRTRVD